MPVNFEWQTDREQEWADEPEVGGNTADSGLRHWRIWLILAAGLILIAVIAYILLNRRAESRSAIIANDVLASHQLVRQAVASRDAELFATLLLPYNQGWRETQEQLLDQDLFLDRVPLGLWAASHLAESEPVVTLAPDLQTAVVTAPIPYIIEKNDTVTETVVLEITAVYERDESQWLLAPPPHRDPFWGDDITEKGDIITLIYPERDAEIGRRLVVDLDKVLESLCRLSGVTCPPSFSLRLTLEPDIDQLLALSDAYHTVNPRRVSGGALSLTLPAPTLVGRPVDEAGYQALVKGYAGWVTAVLVNEFNRVQQLDHAAITRQLAQIDLQPPPLSRERPWQFQLPPPIPWPDQDLLTLCRVNDVRMEVWRYELAESNWVDETAAFREANPSLLERPNGLFLLPMPDDEGAVALGYDFRDFGDEGVYLWQDGNVTTLIEGGASRSWLPTDYIVPGIDKDRFLVFYNQDDEQTKSFSFEWLDLGRCPGLLCQLQTGDGLPLWSPDEQKTLLIRMNVPGVPTIGLGDANGDETAEIGIGWSPSWVDDTSFSYLRPDSPLAAIETGNELTGSELVLAELTSTGVISQSILDISLYSNTLIATLSEASQPAILFLVSALPDTDQPEMWHLMATNTIDGSIERSYLLTFDQSKGVATTLATLNDGSGYPLELRGNGRYLTTVTTDKSVPAYFVYDLELKRELTYKLSTSIYPHIDWSTNGRWFALSDEGMLRLIAPGSRYERPIFHGMDGCGSAVWVNR